MKLWKSSSKRLYDSRMDQGLVGLIDKAVSDWPFDNWEIQIGRDGWFRTYEQQKALYEAVPQITTTMKSKHLEGKAFDLTLYWRDTEKAIWNTYSYSLLYGYIYSLSKQLGVNVRWGADWNQNWDIAEKENWERDFVHYEV